MFFPNLLLYHTGLHFFPRVVLKQCFNVPDVYNIQSGLVFQGFFYRKI